MIQIPPEILDLIKGFALAEPVSVDSSIINIDNDLYFVTDASGKRFTIRVGKRVREKDCDFEARLLNILGKYDSSSLRLVPSKKGALYVRLLMVGPCSYLNSSTANNTRSAISDLAQN
jgi:hypothetical protein